MRALIFCGALLFAATAWGQTRTTYSNIDDSILVDNGGPGGVGWGSCVGCAGGDPNGIATISSSPFITTPSSDGASRDFYISGSPYTDALWWYKVGPNDSATHFTLDFWLNVGADTQSAQALEFDTYQFNQKLTQFPTGTEFMFGTQCNYAAGKWDLWDMANHKWSHTTAACSQFKPNTWYHLTLNYHSVSGVRGSSEAYDSLAITQYGNSGWPVNSRTYFWNTTFGAGPMPAGWTENMGIQFQMDIAGVGASMTEYVDKINLTAW
jgi:hypothetical protein